MFPSQRPGFQLFDFFGLLYVKTKDITSPKCNLTYFKSCIFDGSLEDIATEDLCPMFGVDVRTPIDEDPWHVKMTMKHMFLFSVNAIWNGQLSKIECIQNLIILCVYTSTYIHVNTWIIPLGKWYVTIIIAQVISLNSYNWPKDLLK